MRYLAGERVRAVGIVHGTGECSNFPDLTTFGDEKFFIGMPGLTMTVAPPFQSYGEV